MLLSPDQTRHLYEHAALHHYAVLAVNADSPAAVTDCLIAAAECGAPLIIETSLWQLTGHSYGAGDACLGLDRYLAELRLMATSQRFQSVPVVFHTDHIKGPETVRILEHAIRSGASSVSLDSSELEPRENISLVGGLCAYAETAGLPVTLEMEAGVDDGVTGLDETRALFGEVERRHPGRLALWAPGVGTRHGLDADLGGFSPEAVRQHQQLASDLAGRPIGIALHGSSGLSRGQLQDAVAAGVTKVNWSSESLLIRSLAARAYFAENGAALEKGASGFKAAAMDHGMQSFISQRYVPKVVERMQVLLGSSPLPVDFDSAGGNLE